jgi:hypothetical protein
MDPHKMSNIGFIRNHNIWYGFGGVAGGTSMGVLYTQHTDGKTIDWLFIACCATLFFISFWIGSWRELFTAKESELRASKEQYGAVLTKKDEMELRQCYSSLAKWEIGFFLLLVFTFLKAAFF